MSLKLLSQRHKQRRIATLGIEPVYSNISITNPTLTTYWTVCAPNITTASTLIGMDIKDIPLEIDFIGGMRTTGDNNEEPLS